MTLPFWVSVLPSGFPRAFSGVQPSRSSECLSLGLHPHLVTSTPTGLKARAEEDLGHLWLLFNRPNLDQLGETWLASFTAVAITVQGNGR